MAVLATYTKDPDATLDYTIRWGAPSWITATAYDRYDWAWNPVDGRYYQCLIPHTSQVELDDDSEKWKRKGDLWLEPVNDEKITAVDWDIPTGVTLTNQATDGYSATAWVSGGSIDTEYEIGCEITTDNTPPRIDERTIILAVEQR